MGKAKRPTKHSSGKKKHIAKTWKTKHRTKDLDQIHADMDPVTAKKLLNQDLDYTQTGSAQHYCLHCAKYFVNIYALSDHHKSKGHKRRLKQLREEPYTQAEAERAAGMGSYIPPKAVEVETQEMIDFMS